MENWKAIVFLIASAQGFLLSFALMASGWKKRNSNLFLGIVLFILALELFNAWGMQVKYHSHANVFPFWLFLSYLIIPPALWLYIKTELVQGFKFEKKYLLLFIPALIEVLTETSMYFYRRNIGSSVHLYDYTAWFAFAELLPIVWIVLVLMMYGKSLREINQNARTLHTLKHYSFLAFLSILMIFWIGGVIIDLPVFSVIEMILTMFLFALGYIGYFMPAFFETSVSRNRTAEELFTNYNDKQELERLLVLFNRDKIYLRPRLSMQDVAQELQLPERYISFLVNSYHHTNFNHFVNDYRVKEVLARINHPKEKHKTLLGIAMDCGFSSKSSFNQIFKTSTGQTPSSFLSKQENSSKNMIPDFQN